MVYDHLIIGQGIAGTFLHWYLENLGASCIVIDERKPNTASRTAAGLINPVTGRRIVKSWMIDKLLPFAAQAYKEIGDELNMDCIRQVSILHFFQAPDMQDAFNKKLLEEPQYLSFQHDDGWRSYFNYPFSYGIVNPCYIADANKLIAAYGEKLANEGKLFTDQFDPTQLIIAEDEIEYRGIRAQKIIFCDGAANIGNPWFGKLPYSLNKGEALMVKIPGLPAEHVYKFGHNLIPVNAGESLFWFGSRNEWAYADDQPSQKFREQAEAELRRSITLPFTVVGHKAAIRPANIERRPFCGLHPAYPQLGILNGLGTKGCSLAPYFARQLAGHLVLNDSLLPAVDVKRFERILK